MSKRIVVFGATGYTGGLVTEALVERGAKPLAVGRSQHKLDELVASLGRLETAPCDASSVDALAELLSPGDVLVSTVGPFALYGSTAVKAAIKAGAHYIDSTGEPEFIRRVFEKYARGARGAVGLVTAFGYDFVPGNLAGALALEQAGPEARRVDVGYFLTGNAGRDSLSSGTAASAAGALTAPSYAWKGGRMVTERGGAKARSFDTQSGRSYSGMTVGGTEHWGLPRVNPDLDEVNVYLGWMGNMSKIMPAATLVMNAVTSLPGVSGLIDRATAGMRDKTGIGPDAAKRAESGSLIVAAAYDQAGNELSSVELEGPNGYTFTGEILAWGAQRALDHGFDNSGALAPVDAFGLRLLEAGCAEVGLVAV